MSGLRKRMRKVHDELVRRRVDALRPSEAAAYRNAAALIGTALDETVKFKVNGVRPAEDWSASYDTEHPACPDCPTCGQRAESVTRMVDGPAWVDPCGHFVRVTLTKWPTSFKLDPHPSYGEGIRQQDIAPSCWTMWRLMVSRGGRMPQADPPLHWVEHYRKTTAPPPRR